MRAHHSTRMLSDFAKALWLLAALLAGLYLAMGAW